MTKYPAPKQRPTLESGHEPMLLSEFGVRIFDKVMDLVGEHPELSRHYYFDIFAMFQDVLDDELENYGSELACRIFSRDPVLVRWRYERAMAEEDEVQERQRELVKKRPKAARTRKGE